MSSTSVATNATNSVSMNASSQKNKPIEPAEFDVSKLRFGPGQLNNKNGFTKYQIQYEREDTKDTKCILKFSDVVVNAVLDPSKAKKSEGKDDGANQTGKPNYSLSVKITDPDQLKCLESIESFIKTYVFKNKMSLIPQKPEKQSQEDIDNNFKDMLYRDEKHPSPLFTVNFPFGDKLEPVEVKYMDKSVPKSVFDSVDATQKMGRDSVVDMFVYLKNLKIDSGNTISIQRVVFSLVKVKKFVAAGGSSGAASGKPMNGTLLDKINTADIEIGGIVTNDNGGKSIKPKIKYTAADGSEKTKSISIYLPKVLVKFRKLINKDDNSISFSAVYEPTKEHLEKFQQLDAFFKKAIFDKITKKELPAAAFGVKTMTETNWDTKFRGAVSANNPNYAPSMWIGLYNTSNPTNPEVFDFQGNFYSSDGTKYSNEDINSKIINEQFTCDLNIYVKHIWIGKVYSLKYNVSNVTLDLVANEYDLGDETYFDGETEETNASEPAPTTKSSAVASAVANVADSSEEEEEEEEESDSDEESD